MAWNDFLLPKEFREPKDPYDRQRIAKTTGHSIGCRCCWCGLGEATQNFEKASSTFRKTPFFGLFGLGGEK